MQLYRLVLILALALHCRYTKYLYPLECRKKNLSNPTELQAAIEGNKREGRRGSYGSFASSDMLPMSHHHLGGIPGMPSQISPMSLVTSHQRQFNGSSHHGLPPGKSCLAITGPHDQSGYHANHYSFIAFNAPYVTIWTQTLDLLVMKQSW